MEEEKIIIPEMPELVFEERKHIYTLNGLEIPGVTNLMKPLTDKVYGPIDPVTLELAARKGTIVHNAIDNYLEFDIVDIPEEHKGYFDAFMSWYEEKKPEIVATERKVYHKALRYAGTCDLLCIEHGVLTLVDYKTSYALQPMLYPIQLEGYAKAWATHGVQVKDQMILHLKKDGRYSENRYAPNPEYFAVLNALSTIYNYEAKM